MLRRVPRGYPADHPRADLLRYRRLFAQWSFEPGRMHTRKVVDEVRSTCLALRPLTSWLATYCCEPCPSVP